MAEPKTFKILLFKIEGKKFAVDISNVKKVIKEKGDNIKITEIDGAPPHIIGISEIEIVQNQKDLITLVDFRKIIDIGEINDKEEPEDETKEKDKNEETDEKKGEARHTEKESKPEKESKSKKDLIDDERQRIRKKRRIFMIISALPRSEEKQPEEERKYIGILIDEVEGIKEIREGDNATLYPPPDIKKVKELFKEIAIINEYDRGGEEKGEGERIFILNAEKIFEVAGVSS